MVIQWTVVVAALAGVAVAVIGGLILRRRFRQRLYDKVRQQKQALLDDYIVLDRAIAQTYRLREECLAARRRKQRRSALESQLRDVVAQQAGFFGAWVVWEPNAYDSDPESASWGHFGADGRFNTYVYRDGGQLSVMALPDIDKEHFYAEPKHTRELVVLDPFQYEIDGTDHLMTTASLPIVAGGQVLGVVGIDLPLRTAKTIFRELLELPGSPLERRDPLQLLDRVASAVQANYEEMSQQILDQSGVLSDAISHSQSTMDDLSSHTAVVEEQGQQSQNNIQSLEEVAKAMTDLASVSENLAQGVEGVARISVESAQGAESGTAAMQDTSASMEGLLRFVDVIATIADKTNMLALNASIEASRAGEQGKGFAVVAREVNKLASQSNKAADEARATIEEVMAKARRTLTSMESIAEQARQLDTQVQGMAAEIEEQSATSQEVTALVGEVLDSMRATAEKLNESIRGQEAAMEATRQQLEELGANGEAFRDYAHRLRS